jgi:hypothetical protein
MNKGVMFILLLTLSGCSATDLLKSVNPLEEPKGISATVQVGKENKSDSSKQLIKSSVKLDRKTSYNSERIDNVDYSTNIPWWTALLLLFVRPMVILKDTIDLFKKGR